jgi:anti-sigma factor RsiW
MHEPLLDRLEDYLEDKGHTEEVDRHLAECAECREELAAMKESALILRALRAPEMEPAPGFYARVMNRVEREGKPSLWWLFGESLFAKRLAYASLTVLVLLGTVFVTTEEDSSLTASAPEAIMAEETPDPVTITNRDRDRDVVLVNLATFQD